MSASVASTTHPTVDIDYERLAEELASRIAQMLPGTSAGELIGIEEVAALTGYARSSIYRLVNDLPGFPQPTKLGAGTSPLRWRRGSVLAWIAEHGQR